MSIQIKKPKTQLLKMSQGMLVVVGYEINEVGRLPTARHRCNVSSLVCYPGAKPRRWTQPLVTRFGVILRDFFIIK